ncbi:MAG: TniB family NTP-binding protein [Hyphomicrobiaceae bacterium]|nr:TniB family NTP-binding protein [Hyphomicrobiaceae bacterium]
MTAPKKDPLGAQPPPLRGDAQPVFTDQARNARVEAVVPFFKTNYIDHKPQTDVVEQLLSYLKSMQPLLGGPIDGRCLSEHSNAGKSRMIEHLKRTAELRRAEAGLPPNPYQILCIELDKTTSVATWLRRILYEMGDDHWNDRHSKIEDLEDRILTMSRRLGVEGIVGDEVQHLDRKTTDALQVTDRFKTFLNRGILPLILIGDEDAEKFFEKNGKFASRLGTPLELRPLDPRSDDHDKELFLSFCRRLDQSMVDAGIIDEPAGLGKAGFRTQLVTISSGHVGRVCRVVCEAAQHALRRGAPTIERHDMSVATRKYAMKLPWVLHDPFSKRDD